MRRDLFSDIETRRLISPQTTTGDTPIVSAIIDTQGFGSLLLAVQAGSIGDADVTFQALVEDGNDPSLTDNGAVPDAYLIGIEGSGSGPTGISLRYDSDNVVKKIGYIGPKRYVRLTLTPSGNSGTPSGAFLAALAMLGHPRVGPKSTQ